MPSEGAAFVPWDRYNASPMTAMLLSDEPLELAQQLFVQVPSEGAAFVELALEMGSVGSRVEPIEGLGCLDARRGRQASATYSHYRSTPRRTSARS